jgi:uncharacterized membrane protein YhaH (DUF805 family)
MATKTVTFGSALQSAWARCFDYRGRSSRAEYWWFFLFSLLVSFAVGFITKFSSLAYGASSGFGAALSILTTLILMVPSFSLSFRRMHDTNRSFWKFLLYSSLSSVPIIVIAIIIFQEYNQRPGFYATTSFSVGYLTAYIWSLVIYCLRGDVGENRFGPDPLAAVEPTARASWGSSADVYSQQFGPLGGAPREQPTPIPAPRSILGGISDEDISILERLASLKERGALTDAEFVAEKAAILGIPVGPSQREADEPEAQATPATPRRRSAKKKQAEIKPVESEDFGWEEFR